MMHLPDYYNEWEENSASDIVGITLFRIAAPSGLLRPIR